MSLTKENLLSLMKSNVIALRDKSEELATNEQFHQAWLKESQLIIKDVRLLSPEDLKWMNDEYSQWAEAELGNVLEIIQKDMKKNIDEESS